MPTKNVLKRDALPKPKILEAPDGDDISGNQSEGVYPPSRFWAGVCVWGGFYPSAFPFTL